MGPAPGGSVVRQQRVKNPLLELSKILQAASRAETSAAQAEVIVEAIAASLSVDICSLYLADPNGDMHLVANHGLPRAVVANVRIPREQGLVGLTARNLHPVNIAEANSHPASYIVPGIDDGELESFCGVPLVRSGRVTGVLVVQSTVRRQFSQEDEAFLVTLASQLASINIELPGTSTQKKFRRHAGIKGSPGVAIGKAFTVGLDEGGQFPEVHLGSVEANLERWRSLLQEAKQSIRADQAQFTDTVHEDTTAIFEAYLMLIEDPGFVRAVESELQKEAGLVSAIKHAVDHFSALFKAMEDPYLRSRHEDIRHIGQKLLVTLKKSATPRQERAGEPVVLVGSHIGVSDIAAVVQGQLVGIVSGGGSSLSHAAVLANALGIPAVMGAEDLGSVNDGDTLVVDGNRAEYITRPTKSLLREYQRVIEQQSQESEQLAYLRDMPAITTDGCRVHLYANTGLLADISPGLQNGAEGVGLYRTEIPFMLHETFPSEEEQVAIYEQVIAAYGDMPVYMRVLDIGSDKQLPYFPIPGEDNPAMGWRGIRFALDNSSLLMSQLRAVLRASIGRRNLRILIPMVSEFEELERFHWLLDEACLQINNEFGVMDKPPVGVMVEVPVTISQLGLWHDRVDFIAIGSNDLSQYLLALDRNNARVAARYDAVHPGVISEIHRIVDTARRLQLPVCLCGEMASDPVAVILLLGMGIRMLSMSAVKIPHIKSLVRQVSIGECEQVLATALQERSTETIRERVTQFIDQQRSDRPLETDHGL